MVTAKLVDLTAIAPLPFSPPLSSSPYSAFSFFRIFFFSGGVSKMYNSPLYPPPLLRRRFRSHFRFRYYNVVWVNYEFRGQIIVNIFCSEGKLCREDNGIPKPTLSEVHAPDISSSSSGRISALAYF